MSRPRHLDFPFSVKQFMWSRLGGFKYNVAACPAGSRSMGVVVEHVLYPYNACIWIIWSHYSFWPSCYIVSKLFKC